MERDAGCFYWPGSAGACGWYGLLPAPVTPRCRYADQDRGTASINSSTHTVDCGRWYALWNERYLQTSTLVPADEQGCCCWILHLQILNITIGWMLRLPALSQGSRAANGVLIINTKEVPGVNPYCLILLKVPHHWSHRPFRLLNGYQYATLIPEEFMNRNGI